MQKTYLTTSPWQTKKLGENLAEEILGMKLKKKAIVLGLEGDLGGGKTTFLQGFARGLRVKQKILSPSFVILKRFHVPCFIFHNFYHIDCYRIQKPKEILDLGFKEIISNPQNIVAIEWADRVKKLISKSTIKINFKLIKKKTRKIIIKVT